MIACVGANAGIRSMICNIIIEYLKVIGKSKEESVMSIFVNTIVVELRINIKTSFIVDDLNHIRQIVVHIHIVDGDVIAIL